MTRITNLALNRRFERTSDAEILRRDKTVPAFTQEVGPCYFCNLPVFASPGQMIKKIKDKYTHKVCRKRVSNFRMDL